MFRAASDHCSVFFVITVQFVLYFHTVSFTVNYVIIEYEILWQIVLFLAQITIVGLQYICSSIVTFLS